MTPALWGGLTGGTAALGLVLAVVRVAAIRRPSLATRVLPFVRDVPGLGGARLRASVAPTSGSPLAALVRSVAGGVDRVLGGQTSVRRRLDRAGLDLSVMDFRVEQVLWGLVAFAGAAALGVLRALTAPVDPAPAAILCLVALVGGVLARDTWLGSQVKNRERRVMAEFPTIAELLALAVAAGEGPVAALARVVQRSGGALSDDLARVLAAVRTGEPVGAAFDRLAATTGLPLVARFAQGIAVAVERGTPLADVLHAQAADVREAGRRHLIESAARREVLMMVPVVFLVLPVTVLFAFWPGLIGLSLAT